MSKLLNRINEQPEGDDKNDTGNRVLNGIHSISDFEKFIDSEVTK